MKNLSKNLLKAGLVLTAGTAVAANNRAVRIGAGVITLAGAFYLIRDMFVEDLKEVNNECDETEDLVEKSKVNADNLDSDLLEEQEYEDEDGNVIYNKSLYEQSRGIFSDDETECTEMSPRMFHVLQGEKKLVIALQMPKTQEKNELTGFHMYTYFKDDFCDLALDPDLSINPREIDIYQKGFARVIRDHYESYDELPKLKDESKTDYVKRVNSLIDSWEKLPGFRKEKSKEFAAKGDELKGFENFMFIEFPIRREGEIIPGMTMTKAMWLINYMMGTYHEIPVNRQGDIVKFDFEHVMFHPGMDMSVFFGWNPEEKVIETICR